jgi:hypothetical protein
MRRLVSIGKVKTIYYPVDDKDTSLIGLNYAETDTIKMSLTAERRMERIWMPRASLTLYPITQIPPGKYKLPEFAWFEKLRPTDKNDVFVWRGKSAGQALRQIDRHAAPLQNIGIKKN